MSIDESRVESVQSGAEEGAGVRVLSGGTTYFAHVDGLDPGDLERAAAEAAAALRGERAEPRSLEAVATAPQPIERRPEDVPAERKAALLRELDERGRAAGGEVAQLSASYGEARREVAVANSAGLFSGDDRTRVRLVAQAVARRGDAVADRRRDPRRPPRLRAARRRPGADRRAGRAQGADPARRRPGPGGLDAGRGRRRLRRRPLPRDDRPRARGRPRPEGRERLRGQARRAGRPAAAQRLRRRPHAGRVGDRRDRRRGHADAEDAGDRGRAAHLASSTTASAPSATASPRPATAAARASATCRSRG